MTSYVYPYIFTSDSEWRVDVCLLVPAGYAIVGTYDEFGNLISDKNCVKTFVAGETKVVAFEVIETGSPKKFNVNAEIDAKTKDKTSKKVTLTTETEKKDKLNKQSSTTEFAPSFMIAMLSAMPFTAVIATLAGVAYFTLVYFLSYSMKGKG